MIIILNKSALPPMPWDAIGMLRTMSCSRTRQNRGTRPWALYSPRFWGSWLGVGLMRALVKLPFSFQLMLGRGLGALAWRLARRERRIGEINLRLCFPELTDRERKRLLRQHFSSLGCALFETAQA